MPITPSQRSKPTYLNGAVMARVNQNRCRYHGTQEIANWTCKEAIMREPKKNTNFLLLITQVQTLDAKLIQSCQNISYFQYMQLIV